MDVRRWCLVLQALTISCNYNSPEAQNSSLSGASALPEQYDPIDLVCYDNFLRLQKDL